MKKENPGGFSFFIGAELRIRVKRGKVKRGHKKIWHCVELNNGAANGRPYGRKNPLPFLFSKRSPVSGLRQTIK